MNNEIEQIDSGEDVWNEDDEVIELKVKKPLKVIRTRVEAIEISYPGSILSVNHYLGRRKNGGSYVKPETKEWKTEFQWLLKKLHLEDWKLPLEVKCDGYFKNERSAPDIHNLTKILDVIQEVTGIDDKSMVWHDGKREIGTKTPHLVITIKEAK